MRRDIRRFVSGTGTVVAIAATAFVLSSTGAAGGEAETPELIGAKRCGMCHKKEESGAQLGKWEAGPHSKAFASLASEESVAKAKEMGLGNPQEAPECLRCHATAFAVMGDLANQKITLEEGVSCESCHGAGGEYWKKATMEAIFKGELEGATVGLVEPNEELCRTCHNPENPFHKEFDFAAASKQIAHPYPEGYREAAK